VRGLLALALGSACTGCIGQRVIYPVEPTPEELREFEAAGPPEVLPDTIRMQAMRVAGPYRVVVGDLLRVELPSEVEGEDQQEGAANLELKCRVQPAGTIHLPWIGDVEVVGRTPGEIESSLAESYHDPARLKERPNVVVAVEEYQTVSVAVMGAVLEPGVHELRSDRRSLMGALTAAGGIKSERGVGSIKVLTQDELGATVERPLGVLADIPLEDVALLGGETIVVEPLVERKYSVIGLVKKAGVFPYPAPRRYNLMQVLATAGGVNEDAAPRYATVYRIRTDGQVVGATFRIDGVGNTDGSSVWIKDGDVIAVEHTQGSWLRQFLSSVLGFRASVSVSSSVSPTL